MADFPEYKRRSPIQPAGSGGNIEGTFARAAQSVQVGSEKRFGELVGQQIAQNAANQFARDAGTELGKTPGLKTPTLFPLGESGAHLAKAYEESALQSVEFEAISALRKVYNLAAQVELPDEKTLSNYETWGLKAIQDNVALLPPHSQKAAERYLMQSYNSGFNKLSTRVLKANALRMQAETNLAFSQQMQMSSEAYLAGNKEEGDHWREEARKTIERGKSIGSLTLDQAQNRVDALNKEGDLSSVNGELIEAAKSGSGERYLEELKKKGASPELIQSAEETLLEYKAEEGIVDYELSNTLLNQSEDGSLSEDDALESSEFVSEKTKSQVMGNLKKLRQKQVDAAFAQLDIAKNRDSAIALSEMTPSQIDTFTKKVWERAEMNNGAPLSLEEKAKAVSTLRAPNSVLNGQLHAAMNSLDPLQVISASRAISYLSEKNPIALQGLPKKSEDTGIDIATLMRNSMDPFRAVEVGTGRMMGVSPEVSQERLKRLNEAMSGWKGARLMRAQTANVLDISKNKVTTELEMATYNATVAGWLEKEDMDSARAIAKATVNKTFGPSNALGGSEKYMRSAPNKWMEYGDAIARHQVIQSSKELVRIWDDLNAAGKGVGFRYELEEPPEQGFFAQLLLNPPPIKMRQIFEEPYHKVIEGHLVMESDTATINPGEDGLPSYAIYIETPEGKHPLLNANLKRLRYRLRDPALFEKERLEVEKMRGTQIEKGKQLRKEKRELKEAANKYIGGLPF